MVKIVWILIGLIVYFGGGWIAKDIVFSMIEITNETTFSDLIGYEFIIYSVVAGLVTLITSLYHDTDSGTIPLIVIIITCIFVDEMPLSMGLIILYHIINIGGIIWTICTNDYI